MLSTDVKMTKMKRNDNPWNEASSRVIITDVPEQAARRRRSRRGVNFLAKMKTKLHEIISKNKIKPFQIGRPSRPLLQLNYGRCDILPQADFGLEISFSILSVGNKFVIKRAK